ITVGGPTPITIQTTILNTGHNSSVLSNQVVNLNAGNAWTVNIGTAATKAWLLDSLDFSIEYLSGTAAGAGYGQVQRTVGNTIVHVCYPLYTFAAAGYIQGSVNNQASRTWSQGLLINSTAAIQVKASATT